MILYVFCMQYGGVVLAELSSCHPYYVSDVVTYNYALSPSQSRVLVDIQVLLQCVHYKDRLHCAFWTEHSPLWLGLA